MCFGCVLLCASTSRWRACVEAHRELYNAALQERRDGWSHNKTRISYGDQSAQLSEIRVGASRSGTLVVFEPAGHAAPLE